ncbi:MAG: antibiotic biosynthesis monooxygenase [Rhizomicrobium sp.]
MIVRIWKSEANGGGADAYRAHFRNNVLPHLHNIAGFTSASLLERRDGETTHFIAMTRWASMDAVCAFAGDDPSRAVVEPEAVAALSRFDATVQHYDVRFEEAAR